MVAFHRDLKAGSLNVRKHKNDIWREKKEKGNLAGCSSIFVVSILTALKNGKLMP